MTLSNSTQVYGRVAPKQSDNRSSGKLNNNTGISYAQSEDSSYFYKVTGLELVKKALAQLLRTQPGERFMLPNYGCNLKKYVMEQLDETLFNQVREQIANSVSKYLKEVNLVKLQVFETNTNVLNVKLFCSLKDARAVTFDIPLEI